MTTDYFKEVLRSDEVKQAKIEVLWRRLWTLKLRLTIPVISKF